MRFLSAVLASLVFGWLPVCALSRDLTRPEAERLIRAALEKSGPSGVATIPLPFVRDHCSDPDANAIAEDIKLLSRSPFVVSGVITNLKHSETITARGAFAGCPGLPRYKLLYSWELTPNAKEFLVRTDVKQVKFTDHGVYPDISQKDFVLVATKRQFGEITGIRPWANGEVIVEYTFTTEPTFVGVAAKQGRQTANPKAKFALYDDGWRLIRLFGSEP